MRRRSVPNEALLAVAVAGILGGACNKSESEGAKQTGKVVVPLVAEQAKHVCKGFNACKGQGGCKTGDNGCSGTNSCKGKGGCATVAKHSCAGQNECKSLGGCASGDNGCKAKNSCKGKGGCEVPVMR